MIKRVSCFACLTALLFVCASGSASEGSAESVLKQRERYTVSVALEFNRKNRNAAERTLSLLADVGPNAHAAGFLIGDGLVMTAYHVVSGRLSAAKRRLLGFKPDDELQVRAFVNGCPAKVVKIDRDADLALLSVCGSSREAKRPTFEIAPSMHEQIVLIAQSQQNKFSAAESFKGLTYSRAVSTGRSKSMRLTAFQAAPSITTRVMSSASSADMIRQRASRSLAPARRRKDFFKSGTQGSRLTRKSN